MRFAVNHSAPAMALLRERKIHFDLFKCPDWPDSIESARTLLPAYVHFPLTAGTPDDDPAKLPDFDAVESMARDTGTPCVNLHLVAHDKEFPGTGTDSTEPAVAETILARALRAVRRAVARFGADRVILENVPYHGPGGRFMLACAEPAMVRRVVESTGCGLLLDLSHARIAAHYLGIEAESYLEQLPLDRLRELHLTGVKWVKGRLEDHMEFDAEDFRWAGWALERIRGGAWPRPWAVALEYGGTGAPFAWRTDPKVIEEQVPRLYEMVVRARSR